MSSNLRRAVRDLNHVHAAKMNAARKDGTSPNLEKAIEGLKAVRTAKSRAAVKGEQR